MRHTVIAALAALAFWMVLAPAAVAADNERVAAELKAIIESGEPVIGNEDNDERIVEVYFFYGADRDFKPIWVRDDGPKAKAREVLGVFKTAGDMGLNSDNYRIGDIEQRLNAKTPRELAELELLISRAFIDYGRDVNRGRITPRQAGENAIVAKEVAPLTLIDGAEAADNIAVYSETLEPRSREYGRLKLALGVYRGIEANGGWPTVPRGAALKPGMTDSRVPTVRARLQATGDLDPAAGAAGDNYDPALQVAVRKFQLRHGLKDDAVVGDTTIDVMNVPAAERARQIALNLERRRWMDDNLGAEYVFVNIADQEMKLVRDEKTVHTARIVVGKPYSSTPAFSETIKYIVLNPHWNVPQSIADKEYLPQLKKNPGALRREGIRIFSRAGGKGGEIDPSSVDWSSLSRIPYALRQDPGAKNALGRVKFMFPNRFNIYLHDTPAKSLFDKELRIMSHGCIRVENPLDFATLLLAGQGWTRPKIDSVVASGEQRVVNLKTHVPVHIAYLTAWVDKDGTVNFRRDVYGRDKRLAEALSGGLPLSE